MKNYPTNEDLVSRYLDKELSDIETHEFENRLKNDPELQEEVNFQKDVINSIKESRRMELKSRLSHIQPPTTPLYQTLGAKIAAVASITALVGLGTYYILQEKNELGLTDVDLTEKPSLEITKKEIPTIPEIQIPPVEEIEIDEGMVEEQPVIKKEKKKFKTADATSTEKPVAPKVVKPEIAGDLDESDLVTEDISSETDYNTIEDIKENIESKVAVETEKSRKYAFHYKFYNNKLYLMGDFNSSPYEIIELNSSKGKKFFLFYENSFYRLYSDRLKPTPLEKVEDENIIDELKIILDNK